MLAEADHPLRKQCPETGHYHFLMHKESTLIHLFIHFPPSYIIFSKVISINNKRCSPLLQILNNGRGTAYRDTAGRLNFWQLKKTTLLTLIKAKP